MQHWDLTAIETPAGSRSPVVLASEDARAVLVALEPGQALGDHEVHERAWVTVVAGSARFECSGESFDAGIGTLAMFDPGERHSIISESGARLLLLLAPWPGDGHYQTS